MAGFSEIRRKTMKNIQPTCARLYHPNDTSDTSRPHVLVVGSRGMLGRDLMAQLKKAKFSVIGLGKLELDITESNSTFSFLKNADPGLVINCAAYTAVERAETEPDLAFAVNQYGSANLADACRYLGIPLIHISTDSVFDGNSNWPYREDDPVNPINVYGQSKWEGEEAIRSRLIEHLIIRTSWLYGVHGQNFVKTMKKLANEREEIRVVADQQGCPTWTKDLAEAIKTIVKRIHADKNGIQWGTYHYSGYGHTTWYAFAKAIIEEIQGYEAVKVTTVTPIDSREYPTSVCRPTNSALDCRKIIMNFGIQLRPWKGSLTKMIQELWLSGGICDSN